VKKNVLILVIFLAIFAGYFANFATQLKNFFRKLSARIILVLDATFVPNLTFLGILRPEISFGEKMSPTQTSTHPVCLEVREALTNMSQ